MKWTCRALFDPFKAHLDLSQFKRAFPDEVRGEKTAARVFQLEEVGMTNESF